MECYYAHLASRDNSANFIVVQPPFNPSEDFLNFCGDRYDTNLQHEVTTQNTTLLQVTHRNEDTVAENRRLGKFQSTADFIGRTLQAIDSGSVRGVYHQDGQ